MFSSFSATSSLIVSKKKRTDVTVPTLSINHLYYWTFNSNTLTGILISTNTTGGYASSGTATSANLLPRKCTNGTTPVVTSTAVITSGMKEGDQSFKGIENTSGNDGNYCFSTSISVPTSGGISFSLWFKSAFTPSDITLYPPQVLISFGVGTQSYYDLLFPNNTPIRIQIDPSNTSTASWRDVLTTTNAYDTNWHHLCCTWTGTVHKLYYDNQLTQSTFPSLSITTLNSIFLDGIYGITSSQTFAFFTSFFIIDCVRMYNGILTATDVDAIYKAGV